MTLLETAPVLPQASKGAKPNPFLLYLRHRANVSNISLAILGLFGVILATHRAVSLYMTTRQLEGAPIMNIERKCPSPAYPTLTQTTSKPKICITTLTDQNSTSRYQRLMRWRNYDEVFDISMNNKVSYAQKHGYKTFDGSHFLDTSRPPAWTKVKALRRLLHDEDCDWAVWMDADTMIMNSDIAMESFLPSDTTHDMLCASDDRNGGYNSGVLFFRNTDWSKQFLDDWWNMKSYVRPPGFSLSGDNNALKALLRELKDDFDQHVLVPERCTFNSFARFFTHRQNVRFAKHLPEQEWYLSNNYYHKGDFVAHVAGVDNKAGAMKLLAEYAGQ